MKAKNRELRYRDIDPDSGLVVTDRLIAIVNPDWSKALLDLLIGLDDPNRDFYLIDVDQLPVTVPVNVKVTEAKKTVNESTASQKAAERLERLSNRQQPSPPRNNGYSPYGDFSFDNSPGSGKRKKK